MSNNAQVSSLLPVPTAAAGLLPAAAAAAAAAPVASPLCAQSNSALLAAVHASTVLSDSAYVVLPTGVTPIAASACVVELQSAAHALSSLPPSADSAKSLAHTSLGSSAQPQAEGQQRSGSRDNREKHGSTPSHGQIETKQGAMLVAAAAASQCSSSHARSSSPSHAVGDVALSPGVRRGEEAAGSASHPPLSLVDAAMAAVVDSFRHHRTAAASAAAQHDAMSDVGAISSVNGLSSLADLVARAQSTHCLIVDIARIPPSDAARQHVLAALDESMSTEGRMKAVVTGLPALEGLGLEWVCPEVALSRLHLHFKTHADVVSALKSSPFLVRCGALTGQAWSGCRTCSSVERHRHPEALLLSCLPTVPVPVARDAAIKELLKAMDIEAQTFWQSNAQQVDARLPSRSKRFAFWLLPREADVAALAVLVERVHRQHKLFGGLVSVQGPNIPQLARCSECHQMGHASDACPVFGGTAVRLLFKNPLSPAVLSELIARLGVKSAMLGNAHSSDQWRSSHKVTLFFHFDTLSQLAVDGFKQKMLELLQLDSLLLKEPSIVSMSAAARKSECTACGSRAADHQCPFRGGAPQRPSVPQQQRQQQPGSNAPAAAKATVAASLQPSMCGQWRSSRICSRKLCKHQHPVDWVVAPEGCCRDFYHTGSCKYDVCKYTHTTQAGAKADAAREATPKSLAASLVPLQSAASASASASPPVAVAGNAPAASSLTAPAAARSQQKQQQQQQQQQQVQTGSKKRGADASPARGASSNSFSALGGHGDDPPSSPVRTVPRSSLGALTSPTRSPSTPAASTKKKKSQSDSAASAAASAATDASAQAAAASSDAGGFEIATKKRRRGDKAQAQAQQLHQEETQTPMEH